MTDDGAADVSMGWKLLFPMGGSCFGQNRYQLFGVIGEKFVRKLFSSQTALPIKLCFTNKA